MKNPGVFITATDTGAGKTMLARHLIPALEARHIKLCIRKPVESGCEIRGHKLWPADAAMLAEASRTAQPLEVICPFRLKPVASPARAAQLENTTLRLADLAAACKPETGEFLIVEGAGGFYSPIASDGLNADLAEALKLPLLLVVPDRLGCIGHALLVIEAAAKRMLRIVAVIMNQPGPTIPPADTDNREELAALTGLTVVQTTFEETGKLDPNTVGELADKISSYNM